MLYVVCFIWEVTGTRALGGSVVWGCTNKRNR